MKLRNKKTGEIVIANVTRMVSGVEFDCGQTLAELNAEWEDVPEEPKEYWYIDWNGEAGRSDIHDERTEQMKQIGNFFKTEEEAEKAVERLRAWKRLKDKGFRFDGYDVAHNSNGDLCGQLFYNAGDYCIEDVEKDLDILFGGEE